MLIGLTVVNFSEKCWSHRKNYEWRLNRDFVHIFNMYIFLKTQKLSSTKKQTPVQEGVVKDIVKYYF